MVPIVIRQNCKAYYVQIHINPKQNTQRVSLSGTDTVLKITSVHTLLIRLKNWRTQNMNFNCLS